MLVFKLFLLFAVSFIQYGNAIIEANVLTLLNQPFNISCSKNLPTDISFIFADLKFDGSSIKICEFGPANFAGLTQTDVYVNGIAEQLTSPYWHLFWHFLNEFQLPLCRIGGWDGASARQELKQLGGHYYPDINALLADPYFIKRLTHATNHFRTLSQAKGIVVITSGKSAKIAAFKKRHPGFIYVNDHTQPITSHKAKTNQLFKDPELAMFKPKFAICNKKYTKTLAQELIDKLDAPAYFIIKPLASLRGMGIKMLRSADLDKALYNMLEEPKHYWKFDKQKSFIIEAYTPSKVIMIDNKPYDPTMRVVCFLSHDQGRITVHVIGGYWKTPKASLDEEASLYAKHITRPHIGKRVAIDEHDFAIVRPLFATMMLKAYKLMLKMPHQA